ncbi:YHYH protein [Parasphingorhabdus sp.]|uniref:YHYH protein n=1 Tax=Parasphingorhabdus sp. TaxID=2709688 RepID=UPI003A90C3B1
MRKAVLFVSVYTMSGSFDGAALLAQQHISDGPRVGDAPSDKISGSTRADTRNILCSTKINQPNSQLGVQSKARWFCASGTRLMTANGIPNHATGQFPSANDPYSIAGQTITYAATQSPVVRSEAGQPIKVPGYALNGIKFDASTTGRCRSDTTDPSTCDLVEGNGPWDIEVLGQATFDFGADENHGHVQSTGEYHYHGIPVGMLSAANKAGQAMQLIGWAADGFPIYARYGHHDPEISTSALRPMKSSYRLKAVPDANRPDTAILPMGTFTQDFEYSRGTGDLDECNGRFGVTPEFPEAIYHYYATDSFPFIQRCVKGFPYSLSSQATPVAEPRQDDEEEGRRDRRPPPPGGPRW